MTEARSELKIVLLGKENGGKSCLVVRYLHKRYNPENVSTTIGAGYGSHRVIVDGKTVVLGIWDTAGSERYNAMARVYYRNAKAAVVCYDLTDDTSFERAKFWINELRKYEEGCKVYLCGTKLDLVQDDPSCRKIYSEMAENLGLEIGSKTFETSSKTGENVEEFFYEIAKDSLMVEAEQETRRDPLGPVKLYTHQMMRPEIELEISEQTKSSWWTEARPKIK
ncbi:ras-related protein Rab-24-like isoform X2 [Actinia tenebrosa]|uniref:Ras-related protein Rab-24-like isoform X2 n=1 Tax=Actinia tenebrosa TaxID=6105 RepID=A0A6P8IPL7_ACTTE|nr:ras-related protein Rab-24-like isoform X2 [Actinia tenebrosa]